MVILLASIALAGPPTGSVSTGIWPVDAPVWGLRDEALTTGWLPEPTVRASMTTSPERRTSWELGLQGDLFHRSWSFEGDPWESITAWRIEPQVGARTALGPKTRDRTDAWIDYGGGWTFAPGYADTHPLVTLVSPSVRLEVGVARGKGELRPFAVVESRVGWVRQIFGECAAIDQPCPSVVNAPAGPGVALLVGVTR